MVNGYYKEEDYCTLSPDRILGCTFNYGCYLHDRQYRNEVVNRKTRKEADVMLRDTIRRILKTSRDPFEVRFKVRKFGIDLLFFKTSRPFFIKLRSRLANPWSNVYYYAVRLFAGGAWVDGSA